MGAGNANLQRPRNDRRFPPPGVKDVASDGLPPVRRGGGNLAWKRSCDAQRLSLRERSPRRCGGDFPETPHRTRDNTDFPRQMRKREAKLRLACAPPARRNGAPHGREDGGESDPPLFAAGAPRGGHGWKPGWKPGRHPLPPLRGGRSHHNDPWREGHPALPRSGRINRPIRFPHRRRDLRSLRGKAVQDAFRGALPCQGPGNRSLPPAELAESGCRTPSNATPASMSSWRRSTNGGRRTPPPTVAQ